MSRSVLWFALLVGCTADASGYGNGAIVYGEAAPPQPPAAREETITAPPSDQHVWNGGHWEWTRDGYTWAPGAWVARPRAGAEWVAPHWAVRGRHYLWVRGYFRE
jgi:hypothetical protein